MDEAYRPLIEGLRRQSIHCYFQNPDQLVISRQNDPAWPSSGNSFWVSLQRGQWYLCTWVPVCYRVPPSADLIALCSEFVDHGDSAQPKVTAELAARFQLVKLSEEETNELFD